MNVGSEVSGEAIGMCVRGEDAVYARGGVVGGGKVCVLPLVDFRGTNDIVPQLILNMLRSGEGGE